jgi:hypothetical protein
LINDVGGARANDLQFSSIMLWRSTALERAVPPYLTGEEIE